ncbi:sulfite exporter TauE/SafE family protein, partial [Pelomicrobium sp.]|uniref:sulfite exporter TauE/SafE family protein n=1 Tax=Pelomicrobium sp. TaxID=2815319 RepID=UPI002FDD0473
LQAAYNVGRIASYGAAGAAAGAAGSAGLLVEGLIPMQQGLYAAANLMLIALGLSVAGLWHGVAYLERAGGLLWRQLQPWTTRVLPIDSLPRAFAAGTVWGWLPCGLVYSVLFTALLSASPVTGALVMLAFGAGTLPNLLAMGWFAGSLRGFLQRPWVRYGAAAAIVSFGIAGLLRLPHLPLGIAEFCRT